MTLTKKISAIIAGVFFLWAPFASAVTWEAEWIWAKEKASIPNSWAALRKDVDIPNIDNKATAYISADTKYWLWINDELVVFEGSYTGGPSPVKPSPRVDNFPIASHKYYDEVDISPYLKKGKNTIAALAWYYGDNGQKRHAYFHGAAGIYFSSASRAAANYFG